MKDHWKTYVNRERSRKKIVYNIYFFHSRRRRHCRCCCCFSLIAFVVQVNWKPWARSMPPMCMHSNRQQHSNHEQKSLFRLFSLWSFDFFCVNFSEKPANIFQCVFYFFSFVYHKWNNYNFNGFYWKIQRRRREKKHTTQKH